MIHRIPEYFFAIEKERSISKAAEQLLLSQPYLSQYLAKLENELGVKLFDRSKSPLALTEAGKIYHRYLENLRNLDSGLQLGLNDIRKDKNQVLNIGLAIWRGSALLPDILPSYIRDYPDVKVNLHEVPSSDLLRLISDDTADFLIMHTPGISEEFTYDVILNERILLAANREHPLVRGCPTSLDDPQPFDLRRLERECFIMLSGENCLSQLVNNLFNKLHIQPARRIITTNNTTAVNLVSENLGFSFIPETGARRSANPERLAFYTLDSPCLSAQLSIVYKKNAFVTPAAAAFIDMTKAYYRGKFPS